MLLNSHSSRCVPAAGSEMEQIRSVIGNRYRQKPIPKIRDTLTGVRYLLAGTGNRHQKPVRLSSPLLPISSGQVERPVHYVRVCCLCVRTNKMTFDLDIWLNDSSKSCSMVKIIR